MHRINTFIICLIFILFFLLESTVLNRLSVYGASPQLLIIFVIFSGLFYGVSAGLGTGLAAGLLKDIMGIGIFGLNIVIFGTLGLVAGFLSDKVYRENILTQIVISSAAAYLISGFSIPCALYAALTAPFLFLFLRFAFLFQGYFSLSRILFEIRQSYFRLKLFRKA